MTKSNPTEGGPKQAEQSAREWGVGSCWFAGDLEEKGHLKAVAGEVVGEAHGDGEESPVNNVETNQCMSIPEGARAQLGSGEPWGRRWDLLR